MHSNSFRIQRDYWPNDDWRTTTPGAQQMDESLLLKAGSMISAEYPDVHSLLVICHGYIVFERYYGGYNQHENHEVRSITKSFISALIGIALKEGYLTSLNQTVADLLPDYFGTDVHPMKKTITLRHLLTMTAGFECDEFDYFYWTLARNRDWASATVDLPMQSAPGEVFMYNSAAMHLLSVILTRQTGLSAQRFARTRLFEPLGIGVDHWPSDPQGNSEGAAGLALTPRDMAKLGYLYLNDGKWEGQEIVPAWYVTESTQKHSEGGNPEPAAYGYLWWVVPEVPAYFAGGYGGQYIFVAPEHDLIVITTGNYLVSPPPPEPPIPVILEYVIPAAKNPSSSV